MADDVANGSSSPDEESNNPTPAELAKAIMELKNDQDRMNERVSAFFSQLPEVISIPL